MTVTANSSAAKRGKTPAALAKRAGLVVAAALLGATTVGAMPVNASAGSASSALRADCGGTIKSKSYPSKTVWTLTWANCGGKTVRKKVNLRWAPDYGCSKIPGGSTRKWTYVQPRGDIAYPQGFKSC
ncbi:hypothetical protein [Sphaerimonospora thailandensis]|uniref:Uncharacterized protein n=1 Tax=Sphaerimonospora thailandensis TaxID=795644 RepID=A0A8J3W2F8_9ACTN|nr:hypothetical protein [Sphaerimonospora thailandensis]GIH72751.1 hypothetical protein Mth01_50040 [Sphaerimonospora thailandensis]